MTKLRIKLFFEDKIKKKFDKRFVNIIENELCEYEISEEYGRIGLTNKLKLLYISSTTLGEDDENHIILEEREAYGNEFTIWNLNPVSGDCIPIFVIDTDGINFENIKSFYKNPLTLIHGKPPLIPKILNMIHRKLNPESIPVGLLLINPNKEGTEYSSLVVDKNNIEIELFEKPEKSYLELNWLYQKNNEEKGAFYRLKVYNNGRDSKFEKQDIQVELLKKIWSISEIKEGFKNAISLDITDRYRSIINQIISIENNNNISLLQEIKNDKWRKKNEVDTYEKNAKNTKFSLYLRKNTFIDPEGTPYGDFSSSMKKYLNQFSSEEEVQLDMNLKKFNF